MSRQRRMVSESGFYHVVLRGNAKQLIFEDDADRERFRAIMAESAEAAGISLVAWCLMSNHVHLVLDDPRQQLSRAMQRMSGTYARAFNLRHGRAGNLFEQRFGSFAIEDDAYLMQVVRYVLKNPSSAGLGSWQEYPWSSYQDVLRGEGCTDVARVLELFDGREGLDRFCAEETPCFDGRIEGVPVPDDLALTVARAVLAQAGAPDVAKVKALPLTRRAEALKVLRDVGITVKQMARLTGISAPSIYRALRSA